MPGGSPRRAGNVIGRRRQGFRPGAEGRRQGVGASGGARRRVQRGGEVEEGAGAGASPVREDGSAEAERRRRPGSVGPDHSGGLSRRKAFSPAMKASWSGTLRASSSLPRLQG